MKLDDIWAKLVLTLFFAFSVCIHVLVSNVQETPYMDEVFHVPQTQEYCSGNFWKVSTSFIFNLTDIMRIMRILFLVGQ